MAVWYIWWQRRQHVRGEAIKSPERTIMSIKVLATNYLCAASNKVQRKKDDHMWRRPSHVFMKVNVDASFHVENLSGATGAILQDEWGQFIATAY